MVAYRTRSAVRLSSDEPDELSSVPRRLLVRLVITWPAARNPPSQQWTLVSIIARSVLSEVGYRTSEAEQLLSLIVAVRSAATASTGAWAAGAEAARAVVGAAVSARTAAANAARAVSKRRINVGMGAAPAIVGLAIG